MATTSTPSVTSTTPARGVIYIHSAPRALCPHLEWAVGRALGRAVNFDWADQPVLAGSRRAEFYWEGPAGTGAALATAIRGWEHLRFEVSEEATAESEGVKTSLASAICFGWIAHLPTMPRVAERRAWAR